MDVSCFWKIARRIFSFFFLSILFFLPSVFSASHYTYKNEDFLYSFEIPLSKKDSVSAVSFNVTRAQIGDYCILTVSASDVYSSLVFDGLIDSKSLSRESLDLSHELFTKSWNFPSYVEEYFSSSLNSKDHKFTLGELKKESMASQSWWSASFSGKKESCGKIYLTVYNGYLYYVRLDAIVSSLSKISAEIDLLENSFSFMPSSQQNDQNPPETAKDLEDEDIKNEKRFPVYGVLSIILISAVSFMLGYIKRKALKDAAASHDDILTR